jgi:hypothetical protein
VRIPVVVVGFVAKPYGRPGHMLAGLDQRLRRATPGSVAAEKVVL